ncbi:MAG: hypothetical protein M0R51_13425 [Clostridia bacterium]|nr:hypothetical protein [Clostridia bacterium]
MLIFNNKTQYDNLMANGFEKYPNKRDLIILCQQWIGNGTPKKDLKDNMADFCYKWNSQFNSAKSESLFLNVLKTLDNVEKSPPQFQFATNIVVFQSEVDRILELKDKNLQKIAFIIICLAKWRNANFIYLNSESTIKLKDIFNFAGIKSTGKEQNLMLYKLNSCGFTNVQLKPLLKYIIPSIITEGDIALNFEIDENMIKHWIKLAYPHCERCGCEIIKQSNKQKYCKECAKIVLKEQKLNYWNTRKIEK